MRQTQRMMVVGLVVACGDKDEGEETGSGEIYNPHGINFDDLQDVSGNPKPCHEKSYRHDTGGLVPFFSDPTLLTGEGEIDPDDEGVTGALRYDGRWYVCDAYCWKVSSSTGETELSIHVGSVTPEVALPYEVSSDAYMPFSLEGVLPLSEPHSCAILTDVENHVWDVFWVAE